MDDRGTRIGTNEAVFRQVNERLREVAEGFSVVVEDAEFVCECGRSECAMQIRMTVAEYEEIRSDPKRFLLVDGHEEPEYEKVVTRHGGFVVVEKLPGGPAGFAISEDPRS